MEQTLFGNKTFNKRLGENLIYAGAFDCFKVYRSRLIAVYEEVLDKAQSMQKEKDSGIISIFELLGESEDIVVKYPDLPEYDNKTKLSYEKKVVGVYVTGHPLTNYEQEFKKYVFDVVQKDDKSELCELLNSMFSLVIEHEIKFNNIKNNI